MQRSTTVAAAAVRLGKPYNGVLRLVFLGQIRGEQSDSGRWSLNADDVDRVAAEIDSGGLFPKRRPVRRSAAVAS